MSAATRGPDADATGALALLRALPAVTGDAAARGALDRLAACLANAERDLAAATAQQAFQSRILEAIASGVVTLSARREITSFNHAAETTFGVAAAGFVGREASAIGALIDEFAELFETYVASGAVQLRAAVEGVRGDGTPLVLAIQFSPFEEPGGRGTAMVVVDVTKQRQLEAAHEADVEKARRVQETFSRYLAPHVVASLVNDPGSITLGGERRRATMLFADVRGFTRLAASLSPERVVEILNAYFDGAVRVVFECDGLLDKFYGDGLMAVFGPPAHRDDDATRALNAAVRLHEVVSTIGPRIAYPLQISVGLATGDVVVGHFGSAKRMDYTAIGDAVNLASGLQAAAPAGAIYCDEETLARAGPLPLPATPLCAQIKGRDDPVQAFALYPKTNASPASFA